MPPERTRSHTTTTNLSTPAHRWQHRPHSATRQCIRHQRRSCIRTLHLLGWSAVPVPGSNTPDQFSSFISLRPQSGEYFILFDCNCSPTCVGLQQTISLVAGNMYQLTAFYTNDGGGPGQDGVTFSINGNTIAQFAGANCNNVWQRVSATFVAPPPPVVFRLGFFNAKSYSAIDNISIVEVVPLVPSITVQPSSQSVAPGASATFSFSYTNLQGATNQWFVSIDHGASFKPIP